MPTKSWGALFAEAESGNDTSEIVPVGSYTFVVETAEAKRAASGREMFSLKCKITEGPHMGRVLWTNLVISEENPTAMSILVRNLTALGLDRGFMDGNPTNDQIAARTVGAPFTAKVKHREWNGSTRADIDGIKRAVDLTTHGAPPPPPVPTSVSSAPPSSPF